MTKPSYPGTAIRSVRVDNELWSSAISKAEAEGITVAKVIRDALAAYIAAYPNRSNSPRDSANT